MKFHLYLFGLFAMGVTFTPLTVQHVIAEESVLAADNDISGWVVGLEYIAAPDPFVGDADSASQRLPMAFWMQ